MKLDEGVEQRIDYFWTRAPAIEMGQVSVDASAAGPVPVALHVACEVTDRVVAASARSQPRIESKSRGPRP